MTAAGGDIQRFRAILDGEEYELAWRAGASLLDCMFAVGLDPAFHCMHGRCGSCMVKLVVGEVEMNKNNALSARDLALDYVLLCQSIPRSGDVLVDCDAWGPCAAAGAGQRRPRKKKPGLGAGSIVTSAKSGNYSNKPSRTRAGL